VSRTWEGRIFKLEANGHAALPSPERRWVTQADLEMLHDFLFSGGPPPRSDLTPEEEATLDAMFDELEELSRQDLKMEQ
jgi:hypothetical protein